MYWKCRVVLVSSRDQISVFDAVFGAVSAGTLDPTHFRGDQSAPPSIGAEPRTRTITRTSPRLHLTAAAPHHGSTSAVRSGQTQRTGGEPVRWVCQRRRTRLRRLILLCDVSGSMEPYTRVFLSLLQGRWPALRRRP